MQTLVEAASHIAQEIERTRQHLTNLEQALEGLKPLITIDAATTALPFTATPPVQTVEDASIVNADVSVGKVAKSKRAAKVQPVKLKSEKTAKAVPQVGSTKKTKQKARAAVIEKAQVPSTGAELWLNCLGRKKLSTGELIEEALIKLKLDETSRVVIANRARAWLNASTKTGLVIAAGTRDGIHLYKRAVSKASTGSDA